MRFQIDPQPGESMRACAAIAQAALPRSRGNLIVLGLYVAVGIAAFVFTPTTTPATLAIGMGAVLGTVFALQFEGRSRLHWLRAAAPHSLETHFVELTADGVHAWCAHVDARYPWPDFTKVTENGEFYLFIRANGSGSAIPKRLLDPTTDAALREAIREWAPDRGSELALAIIG